MSQNQVIVKVYDRSAERNRFGDDTKVRLLDLMRNYPGNEEVHTATKVPSHFHVDVRISDIKKLILTRPGLLTPDPNICEFLSGEIDVFMPYIPTCFPFVGVIGAARPWLTWRTILLESNGVIVIRPKDSEEEALVLVITNDPTPRASYDLVSQTATVTCFRVPQEIDETYFNRIVRYFCLSQPSDKPDFATPIQDSGLDTPELIGYLTSLPFCTVSDVARLQRELVRFWELERNELTPTVSKTAALCSGLKAIRDKKYCSGVVKAEGCASFVNELCNFLEKASVRMNPNEVAK